MAVNMLNVKHMSLNMRHSMHGHGHEEQNTRGMWGLGGTTYTLKLIDSIIGCSHRSKLDGGLNISEAIEFER